MILYGSVGWALSFYHGSTTMNARTLELHRKFDRQNFIGGSDARIIMGDDEASLIRLWREKRGEAEPEDFLAIWQSNWAP